MAENNPLDQDELPNLEVKQIDETLSFSLFGWISVFVDAVFCLPVLDDAGDSVGNIKRSVTLILFIITALNAVIMSCAIFDVNDLETFVLVPNV